jgi:phosphocarrier protein
MTEKTIKASNRAGIHARPAAVIVQATKDFTSNIFFEKDKDRINAKSIMGILTLAAVYNSEIRIVAEGDDEAKAVETIARLFETKFEEE